MKQDVNQLLEGGVEIFTGFGTQDFESIMCKKASRRAIATKNKSNHTGIIITHAKDTAVLNVSSLMPWRNHKLGIW